MEPKDIIKQLKQIELKILNSKQGDEKILSYEYEKSLLRKILINDFGYDINIINQYIGA